MTINARCRNCECDTPIEVRKEDWELFNSPRRPLIQEIFPYLTPAQRELLISNICEDCWASLWESDEE